MKIAVLWTDLSGYLNACLKELAAREGVQLFIACSSGSVSAPFDQTLFSWMPIRYRWLAGQAQLDGLIEGLEEFAPDLIIFTGWAIPGYRKVARRWVGRAKRIMTMDNCWLGTAKQYLGVLTSSAYIKPLADAVWLPGERQARFASKLGFQQSQIFRGLYTCDTEHFKPRDLAPGAMRSQEFLFVGRFIIEKGVETLAAAYKLYSQRSPKPWRLRCMGAGPEMHLLNGVPGIEVEGFVQPDRLPELLAKAECLVLPSVFEPWAVVVHEACSVGLLVLATNSVGSSTHLVQPGYNGFIFDKNPASLAEAMVKVSSIPDEKRREMSRNSVLLAFQFSTQRWADTVMEFAQLGEPNGLTTAAPDHKVYGDSIAG